MNASEKTAVIRGREAWARLKKDLSWEDWMLTGNALMVGREECLEMTNSNDLDNKRYRNEFGAWMKTNGFEDMDKAVRSRLFKCMEHRAEIEGWRATLTLSQRLTYNHPNTVIRKWEASTKEGRASLPPVKPGLREEAIRLQDELDAANRKIKQMEHGDDRGPMITINDGVEDIARVLLEWLPLSKRHPVASAMMRALKATAAPRKRKSEPRSERHWDAAK